MLLGQYLLNKGLISAEQLQIVLGEQMALKHAEKIGETFCRLGFVRRNVIIDALSQLNPEVLVGDNNAETDFPHDYLQETRTVILGDSGQYVFIATLHNDPEEVVSHLRLVTRRNVKLHHAEYGKVMEMLVQSYGQKNGRESSPVALTTDHNINRVIQEMIEQSIKGRATDIHLETVERTVQIRFRIDTVMHMAKIFPTDQAARLLARIKGMAGMDMSQKQEPQDGSFSLLISGRTVDFRVSTIPVAHGEKIVIRILDKERRLLDLDELGITNLEAWKNLAESKNGLILVCGGTGSGKTTTLYSTIQYCDRLCKNVVTIEDPIEYRLPFVNQSQVNYSTGFTTARFTRSVLRQDPDIVIVGETRDEDTAQNSIYLAETGHLVYTTLHTNDVEATFKRLHGLNVDMHHLAIVLRGIIVQRLARKLCPHCRKAGCPECRMTGYQGMTLLTEFVKFDNADEVTRVMNGETPYHTFQADAVLKVQRRETDCDELRRVLGKKSFRICHGVCLNGRIEACM